jgi:hypothetical protein
MAALIVLPAMSFAADRHERDQRNQWNNLAIGSGILGVVGLATHDDTLATIGLGGAAYSEYRASEVNRYDRDHDRFYRGDYRYNPKFCR